MSKQVRKARRILITGASSGIGWTAAEQCAARGDAVVVAARRTARLEALAAEIAARGGRVDVIPMDVTDDDSVAAGIERALALGPIDVLVNNAGVFHQRCFLGQDPQHQRAEMEVNYFGALRVTAMVLPAMMRRRTGTIVNVSSLVGAIPCPTVANYSASKAALNAWTHALRGEVARHGIAVTVFMPSHTATEQAQRSTRFDGVPALSVDYTASQLLRAIDRAPRSMAASPVFRMFLRLAGMFPGWAERRMAGSTAALVAASSRDQPVHLVDRVPREHRAG